MSVWVSEMMLLMIDALLAALLAAMSVWGTGDVVSNESFELEVDHGASCFGGLLLSENLSILKKGFDNSKRGGNGHMGVCN